MFMLMMIMERLVKRAEGFAVYQMGKQTMGTPLHAYQYRTDNKLYRIITPQSPLVRPQAHEQYHIDEYPMGVNAIVAVTSATVSLWLHDLLSVCVCVF